jgi:hypothetical protein
VTALDYAARILEDSISPLGVRLTTFEVTFPRFILAEFNTHRVLSRNSASSRAIPPELQIERLLHGPFVPQFGTRVKGMGSGSVNPYQLECVEIWLEARDAAVNAARRLIELEVDKARVNRLLEPFMWHTVIASGTRWSNFFGLRTHEDAQPEFKIVADMMLDQYDAQSPRELEDGEWHLPMLDEGEKAIPEVKMPMHWHPKLSAGRCARVSFDTHHKFEPQETSIGRAEGLTNDAHWSPTEHQAMVHPKAGPTENGNFHGDWWQFRKMFRFESDWNSLMEAKEDGRIRA